MVAAAIAIGLIGWSSEPRLLPAAMLFPALWSLASTRGLAALVAAGYFLAASRHLPQGVSNYFASSMAAGAALWVAASVLFVVVHALAWTDRSERWLVVRYAVAALALSVPPFGIVGWAHPITATGILLPGSKWLGLAAAGTGLVVMTTRFRSIAIGILFGLWIWSAVSWTAPGSLHGWSSVDTKFGGTNGVYADYHQHLHTIERVRQTANNGALVVVLPESALGIWTPTLERLWTSALEGLDVTVYGGAVIMDQAGYDNVMLELTENGAAVRYRQRMPVPVSMWQPWHGLLDTPAGARANFFANPTSSVRDARVATVICYEQLLIWPILQSALASPDVLVAPINGWWTLGTEIVPIQVATTSAWARLFGISLVTAINV